MERLKGKTAVLTGSADGMGKAIAILFAKERTKVAITDINESKRKIFIHSVMAKAAIALTSNAVDYTDELWQKTLDVNLNGVFWICRAFGATKIGSIVIISSIAGFNVVTPEAHVAYGTSKAAVAHLAKLLEIEWAKKGIRVNALAPGYTSTPILKKIEEENPGIFNQWLSRITIGRLNTPEEIANGALFLLSEMSSGVTGTTLHIDGGYTAI